MNEGQQTRINKLQLKDFRSYEEFGLEPSPGLTIVVGPNASGKTNLLEAVRLLTSGESFRRVKWDDLIRQGAGRARLDMYAGSPGGSALEVRLDVEPTSHSFSVNGKTVRRRSDVATRLPSVVFTPEDLSLVKGPAEERRAAIDDLGESLSSAYGALRREYARSLRQRNALLREGITTPAQLDPWTERLAVIGGRLVTHRVSLLMKIAEKAEPAYTEIAGGERLSLRYKDVYGIGWPRWREGTTPGEAAEAIGARLEQRRVDEIKRTVTLAGPHRDDVVFEIGDSDARTRASQGQQRTAALAWKIAELAVVRSLTGRQPVLLLDDVMSELDRRRRAALTRYVGEGLQAMVTATTLDYFEEPLLSSALIVRTREDVPS